MNLGELIRQLETIPVRRQPHEEGQVGELVMVRFDFCGLVPTHFSSYRGYYDQLALGYADLDAYPRPKYCESLAELLGRANGALAMIFTGWKGGEYRMSRHTKVWIDNPGNASGTELSGVRFNGYAAMLLTRPEEE